MEVDPKEASRLSEDTQRMMNLGFQGVEQGRMPSQVGYARNQHQHSIETSSEYSASL